MRAGEQRRRTPGKPKARQRKLSHQELGDRYLITKEEIAHRYSVSARTIEFWVRKRRIPTIKVGRQLRFRVEECDRAVERFK
jgi:excisionase family DNA binding protein